MTLKELMDKHGKSLTELSKRFKIPYRTVQSWAADKAESRRRCADYIIGMMDELLEHDKTKGGD